MAKPVNEKPQLPKPTSASPANLLNVIGHMLERLSQYLAEYAFRINRSYQKDGSEQATYLTLNASAVSAPAATSGEASIYINADASIAGDELKYQSDSELYTIATFSSAGIWDSLMQSFTAGKAVGVNAPTWTSVNGDLQAYGFSDAAVNDIWIFVHVDHMYKQGTEVFPHIHWTPGNSTNTGDVLWKLDCSIAKGGDAFAAQTTKTATTSVNGTAHQHYIVGTSAIPATNIEPESIMMMRLYRDGGDAADTFTGNAYGLYLDINYQRERIGTLNRIPPYYT